MASCAVCGRLLRIVLAARVRRAGTAAGVRRHSRRRAGTGRFPTPAQPRLPRLRPDPTRQRRALPPVSARHDQRHRGISAFIISMKQPGVQQRPLRMINGVTTEFGQVFFDGAFAPADHMVGAPGEGWALAMTVVGHERDPSTLGYAARYGKLVRELAARTDAPAGEELAWAV